MKTFKPSIVLALLGILAGSQLHAQNLNVYFDRGICQGSPMTRAEAMSLLSIGVHERVITENYGQYLRSRRCYPEFGCQDWHSAELSAMLASNPIYGTTSRVNGAQLSAITSNQKILLQYVGDQPEYVVVNAGQNWIRSKVDGTLRNSAHGFSLGNIHYSDSAFEDILYAPATGTTDRVDKLTSRCYWSKVSGAQEKADNAGNHYRLDVEFVVHAAF